MLLTGELPDSVIVQKASSEVLYKSDAVCHILERLGGIWLMIGVLIVRVPRGLRDSAYDWIAARRKRLFGTAEQACPLLPPHLRTRFLRYTPDHFRLIGAVVQGGTDRSARHRTHCLVVS